MNYNPNMTLKEFVFIIRRADGSMYELSVPARREEDAERRLKMALDLIAPQEMVLGPKRPENKD